MTVRYEKMMIDRLCPEERGGVALIKKLLLQNNILVLQGQAGMGKTTVLETVARDLDGLLISCKDYIEAAPGKDPFASEEVFGNLLLRALQKSDLVIVDDFNLVCSMTSSHALPRLRLFEAYLTALCNYAVESNKRIVFGTDGCIPAPIKNRAFFVGLEDFKREDYEAICGQYLDGEVAARLNYDKIHRFAQKLNAHLLKKVCLWLKERKDLDTEQFIEYLRSQHLNSNVDLGEVQAVSLEDLKGVDNVIQALEANIIIPLENDELAQELDLKPKRGVLLAGPPGTGKTTIGRALAHRLKGKFFLIDGTFISGTNDFYGQVHDVFQAAKQNAPSVIFVDDSDVIFESGGETGLYRYLLTMLDGLESESLGRICLMMTAMNVGSLPAALVRSGRIELWLEMQLPDREARAAIVSAYLAKLPPPLTEADLTILADATEGLTGADIKRLMEDGKTLYAYDKVKDLPIKAPTEYFLTAINTLIANKEKYVAEASVR